ncbi:enoyl-CoA hydratase/isomerase family protein [Streptomyces cuspidosporus]|uniref:2-(1,2-epoxy-1,2-dihydrophenyl)acetyl-CoA isomerase PaaG n=1 Tax=Streptomyces cuspidosporus TaxID=66882 RepID=A0ABN3FGC3_9ACTN
MTSSPEESPESVVRHATDNGVAWITLNRPAAMNAITPDQRERLISRFDDASADPAVGAVVLTATGKGFCAGADLRGGGRPAPGTGTNAGASTSAGASADTRTGTGTGTDAETGTGTDAETGAGTGGQERVAGDVARLIRRGAQRLIAAVLDCEKPVVAAVNGTAAGLGAHLAFACDLVLAAESARFIEVFVRRGLVPDGGGAYLLPRLVGPQRAKELMFFGDALSAAEAERIGLINRVVPDGDLAGTAREWAERLAGGPTRAIALTKQLVNESLGADRAAAFAAEAAAQEINMTTADAREGVRAFTERRAPRYRGR